MSLSRHLLESRANLVPHDVHHGSRLRLLTADPRSGSPATPPTFEGELVAVKTAGTGWATGARGLAYLLVGVTTSGGLAWGPVAVGEPYVRLDCTGNPWTSRSWELCGF